MPEHLWEVSLRVPDCLREQAIYHIGEFSPAGFEERDTSGPGAEFVFHMPQDGDPGAPARFARLISLLGVNQSALNMRRVANEDWVRKVRESIEPVVIGDLCVVPPWLEGHSASGQHELTITPASAFGTGHHESTRLALGHVLAVAREPGVSSMLDVGCGTGILALGALVAGVEEAYGCDIDGGAVSCATENARINGLADRFHIVCADISDLDKHDQFPAEFPLVAANLSAVLIQSKIGELMKVTGTGGRIILSGLYGPDASSVSDLFCSEKWCLDATGEEGHWRSLVFRRKR